MIGGVSMPIGAAFVIELFGYSAIRPAKLALGFAQWKAVARRRSQGW